MDKVKQAGKTLFKAIATEERSELSPNSILLKQNIGGGQFKHWNELVEKYWRTLVGIHRPSVFFNWLYPKEK